MLSHGYITLDSDMSDRKSTLPEDPGQPAGGGAPVSLSRRRFARGAAPVVLGTLVSTPVLGAAPYHCTVSGHVSGDASPRVGAGTTCVLGQRRSYWLASTNDWTSLEVVDLDKGDLPDSECNFPDPTAKGTLFSGFASGVVAGGLAPAFFYSADNGTCNITVSGTDATRASLYQVLATNQTGELFDLGRATVVSLLNYYDDPAGYPVTAARIIHMFNSTYNDNGTGTYDFNATVKWSRAQVVRYLTSLYPAD